jgi:hypothetical protein
MMSKKANAATFTRFLFVRDSSFEMNVSTIHSAISHITTFAGIASAEFPHITV